MKWKVVKGSVQGRQKPDNRDALFVREVAVTDGSAVLLAGIADGITKCPFGGAVARWVCRFLEQSDVQVAIAAEMVTAVPAMIVDARDAFRADLGQSDDFAQSGSTLTIAIVVEDVFHGFWVGDSPILFSSMADSGLSTECITRPDINSRGELFDQFGVNSPLNIKHVERHLRQGDVITLASDGFTRIWDTGSLSSAYTDGLFDKSLARYFLDQPFRDDATFIAIRIEA